MKRLRPALWIVALIAAVAVVYVVVIALYARSGTVSEDAGEPVDTSDAVLLRIEPQAIEAAAGRIALDIELEEAEPFVSDDGISLTQTINVLVTGASGARTLEFAEGSLPSPVSVELIAQGIVEQWPFDSYTAETTLLAYCDDDGERTPLETFVSATGRVPGWNISAREVLTGGTIQVDGQPQRIFGLELTATRSGSTVAFGVMLLGLMIVMPVLVLSVAISVYRGRRRVEPSFTSWMGAMLFATIPLRSFLPGSPPIGSWIDFLIVLWVIVGLIAGLAIYVAAWFRWSPRLQDGRAPGEGPRIRSSQSA